MGTSPTCWPRSSTAGSSPNKSEFSRVAAAFKISLPAAGCITGVAQSHVIAVGKKSHTFRDDGWCGQNGNFCLRYLIPDELVLLAHDSPRRRRAELVKSPSPTTSGTLAFTLRCRAAAPFPVSCRQVPRMICH